jgi:hypothetical protein
MYPPCAPLFLKQNCLLTDDATLAADGSVGNGDATAVQEAKPGRPLANAAVRALAAAAMPR